MAGPSRRAPTRRWVLLGIAAAANIYVWAVAALAAWAFVPMAFGWQPVAIVSGSMGPLIRPGDVVVIQPYQGGELPKGAVVTFDDPAHPGRLVTHRVVEQLPDRSYRTKGDANPTADSTPVTRGAIRGMARIVVPSVARPLLWQRSGQPARLAAWVLATALALVATRLGWWEGHTPEPSRDSRPTVGRRHRRRIGRGRRRRIKKEAVLTVTVILLGAFQLPAMALAGSTDNSGNAWAAATLAAPTSVTATGGCTLLLPKVTVEWAAAAHATGYRVLRATTTGGPYTEVGSVAGTSFTDQTVLLATTYYYVVHSTSGDWSSALSAEAAATTPAICL